MQVANISRVEESLLIKWYHPTDFVLSQKSRHLVRYLRHWSYRHSWASWSPVSSSKSNVCSKHNKTLPLSWLPPTSEWEERYIFLRPEGKSIQKSVQSTTKLINCRQSSAKERHSSDNEVGSSDGSNKMQICFLVENHPRFQVTFHFDKHATSLIWCFLSTPVYRTAHQLQNINT